MNYNFKQTQCVHSGKIVTENNGIVSPLFPATAYSFFNKKKHIYPRYYNTPNQEAVVKKLCALENGEAGLVFSSGMAAISSTFFALLKPGDHAIFQHDLYGGTHHAILREFNRYNIEYTYVDGGDVNNFESAIKENTKLIYVESPSNPLMKLTDLGAVASLAKSRNLITVIDNTFASPINQNPINFGIDVVIHSGTKYLGGHSDIICGALITSNRIIEAIYQNAVNFGGTLNASTCHLLERSLKTLSLRVKQQNENAMKLALFLQELSAIKKVNYPGLESHPDHTLAKKQMPGGFGGMLSFEIDSSATTTHSFLGSLNLIEPAMSLGGVESIINISAETSHSKLTTEERKTLGISDNLLRLSVGIEDVRDLTSDIKQALNSY